MELESQFEKLDHRTDAVLAGFERELSGVLSKASVHVSLQLRSLLDLAPNGAVLATAKNLRTIRSLPTIFRQAMETAGYGDLLGDFIESFDGGMSTFEKIIEEISNGYEIKPVTFTQDDLAYFTEVKKSVLLNLDDVVENVGNMARRNIMFTVAGNPFHAAAITLAERLHIALGEASTLAATGISTFYRTINDRGTDKIEAALPRGQHLEYKYYGPPAGDKLIRPFCQDLMRKTASGRTWTKAQIDGMDNGQLDDVFRTGGGYNCRHQWIVAREKASA